MLKTKPVWNKSLFFLLLIFIVAAFLRFYQAGLYKMWLDELVLHDSAVQMARHGVWAWVGNRSQFAGLAAHSPFSTYLMSLPYIVSTNPQVARLFLGFGGLISIGISYYTVNRYFGKNAALVSSAFMAVMPLIVEQGRWVWNPNLAAPFICLYTLTALLAFYENKRWVYVAHFLSLSAVIQTQAAYLSLIPLSVLALIYALWNKPEKRLVYFKISVLALFFFILSFIPWGYGLYLVETGQIPLPGIEVSEGSSSVQIGIPSFAQLWTSFATLNGGANFHLNTIDISTIRAGWYPSPALNLLFYAQATLVLAIILWILWRISKGEKNFFPAIFLIILSIYPLVFEFLAATKRLSISYMFPMTYAALPLLGIGIATLAKRYRLFLTVPILFLSGHLWLDVAYFDWYSRDPLQVSLSEVQNLVESFLADSQEIIVFETNSDEALFTRYEWQVYWSILTESYPIRVVNQAHAFPIPIEGALYLSPSGDSGLPSFLTANNVYTLGERQFHSLSINTNDLPALQFHPTNSAIYGDILEVQGIAVTAHDSVWEIAVLWTIHNLADTNYQFSVRVLDDTGNRYGQIDGQSLEAPLWRVGDRVFTRFYLPTNHTFPSLESSQIELVVYSYPELTTLANPQIFSPISTYND